MSPHYHEPSLKMDPSSLHSSSRGFASSSPAFSSSSSPGAGSAAPSTSFFRDDATANMAANLMRPTFSQELFQVSFL